MRFPNSRRGACACTLSKASAKRRPSRHGWRRLRRPARECALRIPDRAPPALTGGLGRRVSSVGMGLVSGTRRPNCLEMEVLFLIGFRTGLIQWRVR